MTDAGLLASKQELTKAQVQETLQTVLGEKANIDEAMSSLGLSAAIEMEESQTVQLTAKKLQEAYASGKLTEAQAQELAMRFGLSAAIKKQTASTLPQWIATLKASALVIWENVKATAAWLVTTPAGWLTLTTAAFAGLLVVAHKSTKSLEALRQEAKDSKQNYDNLASEVNSLNTELETTEKRLKELGAIGYDNLSLVEQEEYDRLVSTNNELERELRIKEALARVAAAEAGNAAKDALTTKTEDSPNQQPFYSDGTVNVTKLSPVESLNEYLNLASQQQQQLSDAKKALIDFENTFTGTSEQMVQDKSWKKLSADVSEAEKAVQDTEQTISEKYTAIEKDSSGLVDSVGNVVPGCEDIADEVDNVTDRVDNYFASVKDEANNASDAVDELNGKTNNSTTPEFKISDETNVKTIDDFQKKLSTLSAAMKKVKESGLSSSELMDLQQEFPSLVGSTDDLNVALSNLVNESLEDVISTFSELGASDDLINLFKQMAIEAQNVVPSIDTLMAKIESCDELISVTNNDVKEHGAIQSETLQKIISQYPKLESVVASYLTGVASSADVIEGLTSIYNQDADNYRKAVNDKLATDASYYATIKANENAKLYAINDTINGIINGNQELVSILGGYYQADVQNFRSLAEAKANIEEELIRNCSKAWAEYYRVQVVNGKAVVGAMGSPHGGAEVIEMQKAQAAASSAAKAYNEAMVAMDSLTNISINAPGGKSVGGNKGGGGSKKDKEDEKKILDWIPTALDYAERKRQEVADIIDDENTAYEKQLSLMNELLANDEEVVRVNKEALDIYLSQWEAIRQKIIETFGETEGNALIGKVMMGSTSSEDWKNEYSYDPDDKVMSAKMKLLEDAESAFETYTKQDEKYKDKVKEHSEDIKKQFEIRVNIIKESLEELKSEMSQIESEISLKEITGRIITESDYKDMINLADDQIDLQYEQIDALEEYLDELDEGSAEWYSVKSQISSCKDAIRQCEENQAKWNEEILNLPIRRIERYLELLKHIKQDMTNKIDEQSSLGIAATRDQLQSLIDISVKQIEKLKEEHDELTKKLGNYEYGSDKFNETANSLQDVEDEISSLIQAQNEWNKQILQIPLDNISKLNEQLGNIRDALNGITDTYDTAIGAVVDALDDQVDAINDLKDATTKEYDAKIKPYQDELDLLKKQNEERKIQLALEQAAYDLDRAQNQKTNKVSKIAYFYSNVKYASSYIG